ncbi:hypothetical protein [Treponema sp. R80B11-R83G3]
MGKVIRWFITIMAVGMIPMFMRVLVYLLLIDKYTIQPVLISDVIVLGLVLNIGIFNERHGHFRYDLSLSDTSSTISVILIVLFSGMFFFMVTNEVMPLFKHKALFFVSILFNVLSIVLCIIYIITCYPFLKNKAILELEDKEEQ